MIKWSILLIFFVVTSCTKSTYVPPGIIKPSEMQSIFWDIIRGDILAQEIVNKDSIKNMKAESYTITEKIFSIHNINRTKFEKSIVFYEKNPWLIKIIFDSLNSVQTRKNSTQSERHKKGPKDFHIPRSNLIQ